VIEYSAPESPSVNSNHSDSGSGMAMSRPLVVSEHGNREQSGTQRTFRVDAQSQIYVDIMTKFSVLSTIIVVCNQIFGVWLLCTVHINTNHSEEYVNVLQNVGYALRDVEGLIDCVVVYLTFKMNANLYDQWCCCCHSVLKKLYMANINREIERKISSRIQLEQE